MAAATTASIVLPAAMPAAAIAGAAVSEICDECAQPDGGPHSASPQQRRGDRDTRRRPDGRDLLRHERETESEPRRQDIGRGDDDETHQHRMEGCGSSEFSILPMGSFWRRGS